MNGKKEKKNGQAAVMKKILHSIAPYRLTVIVSIIMAAASVLFTLYLPILSGQAIDYIIGYNDVDFDAILRIIRNMIFAIAGAALSQWIMNIANNRITYRVIRDMREAAFRKIEVLPLGYLDSNSTGNIVSRVVADVDQFADGLLMGFSQLFTGVITIAGTLFFLFRADVGIALVVVLITPVSLFAAAFVAKRTYSMFLQQSATRGEQTALIDEMIGNQKVVQAFGYEDESLSRFTEINERLRDCSLKATFFSSITNPTTRFVNSLVYTGVGLTGALTVISGGITVGTLTCLLSYANQYTKPFNEISGVVTELQNAIACAERIYKLIDEVPEVPDAEDAVELGKTSTAENMSESGKTTVAEGAKKANKTVAVQKVTNMRKNSSAEYEKNEVEAIGKNATTGEVVLDHVAFSYVPEKPLIENLNLSVRPGQRIAIVGPTGCGKTTMINLLMRFYDVNAGSIRVDGEDIRHIARHSLRSNYGMVLQDTWLKPGTVRENIKLGKPDATDEEMIAAAKAAHAHSFIERLPEGYDTVVTEDGDGLSQGQKQLLCITRVMLDLPPMLILDEATSSIDTRTEQRIQRAFAKMMAGRTSFIIAHRLSTIRDADVILVMRDGHIIEQGRHEELLEKGGFYAELYMSQLRRA
ncbi:MAG: ABC transporter ATP-binding protein/permease [Lachnospiraceae bacterium]|nr:ABC transporter ATP-binding protein/permease [Lachnospiraceae bacterium]